MSKWSDPSPDLIRRHRKLKGLTLKEAAVLLNTAPANVSNHENGKHTPTPRTLAKYAEVYECDVDDFYAMTVPQIKVLSGSVIVGYLNNPDANIDRKASVASNLLIQLPETADTNEEGAAGKTKDDLFKPIKRP